MIREWGVQHRTTLVVVPRADRLDAENSARLDRRLNVVTREVSPWQAPVSEPHDSGDAS